MPGVYSDQEDYFNDIATAYRQELDVLYAAGCRHVQIDDPILAFFCDLSMLDGLKDEGQDPNVLFDAYIRLYNNCLTTRPQDMTVSLHICRGNFRSMHFSEGGYDAVATKLFNDVNVDCYYLEFDTPRAGAYHHSFFSDLESLTDGAGTFEPLKCLPKHKSVVLGIITSKFPELEDKEQLKERVLDAARVMASGTGETVEEALQRIGVSPQCGFASHEEGNRLTAADMKLKLELVRDLATSIWGDA